jgi:ribosomal protein RSM22 (predicted rRNA methylase)
LVTKAVNVGKLIAATKCPHDRACPLFRSGGTPLVCGFSQRLERPTFLRRTKHSGIGHEDVYYSYVVLRRGPRPDPVNTSVGRIGGIGKQLLEREKHDLPPKELEIHGEGKPTSTATISQGLPVVNTKVFEMTGSELQAQLRKEAYQWPRLVFPPLKKSGHIILDTCTADGI